MHTQQSTDQILSHLASSNTILTIEMGKRTKIQFERNEQNAFYLIKKIVQKIITSQTALFCSFRIDRKLLLFFLFNLPKLRLSFFINVISYEIRSMFGTFEWEFVVLCLRTTTVCVVNCDRVTVSVYMMSIFIF